MRFAIALALLLIAALPASAGFFRGGVASNSTTQSIASINLSSTSFVTAGGTSTVGTISATMSPSSPTFSGSFTLGTGSGCAGTDNAGFSISGGTTLQTTEVAGTYSIGLVATQGSATNSPFCHEFTITGTTGTVGTSTLYSFDSGGTGFTNQIGDWTTDGSYVDANNGSTLQVGNAYYRYGMSWGCGFSWNPNGGPWCGYKVYSTTDLSNKSWHYEGLLFDPALYQGECGAAGCWAPSMIHNASTGKFVLWGQLTNLGGYWVWVCDSPTGGATPTTPGTNCVRQADQSIGYNGQAAVDPATNIAYLVTAGGTIYQLDSTYTHPVASEAVGGGEAFSIFFRGGLTYVLFGSLCPDCTSSTVYYVSASSPLGTYSAPTTISTTGCGGQNSAVSVLTTAAGTVYLYEGDLWSAQSANEAQTERYKEPLTFTGSAINSLTCSASKTIDGVVLSATPTKPAGSDQSSWPLGQFRSVTTIGNGTVDYGSSVTNVLQSFVPTNSGTLTSVQLSLGIGETYPNNSYQTPPNAPLTVSIVALDGSGEPLATLSSVTVSPTGLLWSPTTQTISGLSASLTGGVTYGLELSTTSTNATDYAIGVASNNPYPAGVYKTRIDPGHSWATQTNKALLFSTFGPVGSFVGPCDIQACAEAFSLNSAMTASYSGPLFQVIQGTPVSTNPTGLPTHDAIQTGAHKLDIADLTSFCGAPTFIASGPNVPTGGVYIYGCLVSKIYAQIHTGANDEVPSYFRCSSTNCYAAITLDSTQTVAQILVGTGAIPSGFVSSYAAEYIVAGDAPATGIPAGTSPLSIMVNYFFAQDTSPCCSGYGVGETWNNPLNDAAGLATIGGLHATGYPLTPGCGPGDTTNYCIAVAIWPNSNDSGIVANHPVNNVELFAIDGTSSHNWTDDANGATLITSSTPSFNLTDGAHLRCGGGADLTYPGPLWFREGAFWNSSLGSTDRSAMFANEQARYPALTFPAP